jgi:hypothetical protein
MDALQKLTDGVLSDGGLALQVLLQDGKSERLTVRAGPNTTSVQDALTEYRVIESFPQGLQAIILSGEC